jgi:3-oxoacyl-[acyl-carrier-protein] synthase-3
MIFATYFPEKCLSNSDLESEFPEWTADKIEQKVGIVSRHVASGDETPLDMAEQACRALFQKNPELKDSVDYLLFCTQNPDHILPGNSSILQNRLGLPTSIGALDYNLGCSGYVYGLSLAKGLLKSGIANGVLLITAEAYTRRIHPKDKGNRSIFGDAATATFLNRKDTGGIGEFVLGTDGSGAGNLIIRNGGLRHGTENAEEKEYGSGNIYTDNELYMDGPEIFNFTIEAVPPLIKQALEKNRLEKEDIDLFILHQANSYILNFLRKMCRIPAEKFYLNMKNTGNTVSSTIPVAIRDALDSGLIHKGDKVLIAGFGVGYSYGATVLTLS